MCFKYAATKLAKSPLNAQKTPEGCLGHSKVAQRTYRSRSGRQRSPRRSVAQRSLKGGRRKAHASPWSQVVCTPLCNVHWAIIVATTVPPFGDHGNPWATMAMDLPPICLFCTTCCVTKTVLVVQGTHTVRAAAVTQKEYFLGLGDHLASWSIFWWIKGGTKVSTLCKGGFIAVVVLCALCTRCSTFLSDRNLELYLKVIVNHMYHHMGGKYQ